MAGRRGRCTTSVWPSTRCNDRFRYRPSSRHVARSSRVLSARPVLETRARSTIDLGLPSPDFFPFFFFTQRNETPAPRHPILLLPPPPPSPPLPVTRSRRNKTLARFCFPLLSSCTFFFLSFARYSSFSPRVLFLSTVVVVEARCSFLRFLLSFSLSTPREIGLQILSSLLSRAVFFLRLDSLSSIAHVRRLVRKTWWPEGRRLYSVGDRHETFAFWRCWRNRFADGSNFRWLDGSRDTREQEREHKTLLSRKERWLSS